MFPSPLLAGAGYLEMAAAAAQCLLQGAASASTCLVGTAILAPLILASPAASPADFLAASLRAEVAAADGTCRLASGNTVHVSTRFAQAAGLDPAVGPWRAASGLGSAVRKLLKGSEAAASAAAAWVQQPAVELPAEFILNPAVLDSCLQLGGLVPAQQGQASRGTT